MVLGTTGLGELIGIKVRGEKGDENRTQNSEDGNIGQGKK